MKESLLNDTNTCQESDLNTMDSTQSGTKVLFILDIQLYFPVLFVKYLIIFFTLITFVEI